MATFLRPNIIQAAANRLVASRARSGFVDFLVLKRALKNCGSDTVPFSSKDANFTGAIHELAGIAGLGNATAIIKNDLPQFFKVFGTAQQVSEKMVTNGSADTLSGPAWQPVVRLEGQRPRRGGLQRDHEMHLEKLLLKNNGDKPSLADAAIWFFRTTDLESKDFAVNGDGKSLREAIENAFVSDLGLNNQEIRLLFDTDSSQIDSSPASDLIQPAPASPETFLPHSIGQLVDETGWIELVPALESDAQNDEVSLKIDRSLFLRFTGSLLAKKNLILTGLAGSGKTKIAQAFAHWITPKPANAGDANPHHALIPVGADWTGNENIVGYSNGLDEKKYVTKPALKLILHAANPANKDVPHFLILDEMNLSHVERYFADLLSAIESGEEIPLYEGDARTSDGAEIPRKLRLPDNLFIIGTVNVDETTYMFSPKVLDRANVIEFRMEVDELARFLASPKKPNLDELDGKGVAYAKDFVAAAADKSREVPAAVKADYEREMLLFFKLLRAHNAEFGYRTGYESVRFVHFYKLLGGFADADASWFNGAMDCVIVQKFLPKLHGSRSKMEGLLWALAWACGAKQGADFLKDCLEAGKAQDEGKFSPEKVLADLGGGKARYPLSFEKVMRMWEKLKRDQFVSFAEA